MTHLSDKYLGMGTALLGKGHRTIVAETKEASSLIDRL
jgi:hypothetical protein